MVKTLIKYSVALIVIFFASSIYARTIKSVSLLESGLNNKPNDEMVVAACKEFKLTLNQIREFFIHAYPVENYVSVSERPSPCLATGKIIFSDNSRGDWTLMSSGVGEIVWERGGSVRLFYKNYKWYDPYHCNYGPEDDPNC